MSDISGNIFPLNVKSGFRRDGTMVDGNFWNDGQWVRFNRGRPRKMPGFNRITKALSGPTREVLVWSRQGLNVVLNFSVSKVEELLVDNEANGSAINDRTPAGFTPNTNYLWSVASMYDAAVGSTQSIVLAVPIDGSSLDSSTPGQVYWGPLNDLSQLQAATDGNGNNITCTGGLFVTAPYAVYYGTDGVVTWSNANEPRTVPTSTNFGDAGSARITATKIVHGAPVSGVQGPAGLLWSLDSVYRMDYVGGAAIFRFTPVTNESSIIARNSVIEYDGAFFWVGLDRFLVYAGGQVQELPNVHNYNWFFDNLNFAQRNKIWATKVPRFGEIWWFFPTGTNTECDHAIIYNIREKSWYDVALNRSAGMYSQLLRYPVYAYPQADSALLRVGLLTNFNIGDTVTGTTSNARGVLTSISGNDLLVTGTSGTFATGEAVTSTSGGSSTASLIITSGVSAMYAHEKGLDQVEGDRVLAIPSWVESCDMEYLNGLANDQQGGRDVWTRLLRVEPDFVQSGDMTLSVIRREFPASDDTTSQDFSFSPGQGKIDLREQARTLRLRFTSNTQGGNYEMGKVLVHMEPGDVRS